MSTTNATETKPEHEKELVRVLKEAVEDQRYVEVVQDMIEWYSDAVAVIARVEGETDWVRNARSKIRK